MAFLFDFVRMGNLLEYKATGGNVVDIDDTSRRIVMNWSAMEEVDTDGDLITRSAYNRTIKERGPQGANLIYWIRDHRASTENVLGKLESLTLSGNYLQAVGIASNTTLGNDMFQLYKDGIIRQHSVGFVPIRTENEKNYRRITEIQLYEGSSVLWGANSNTGTVSVGKSLMTLEECNDELDHLLKAFKNGKYSDDTFSLLELRIKQIQKYYSDLVQGTPQGGNQERDTSKEDNRDKESEIIKSFLDIKNIF